MPKFKWTEDHSLFLPEIDSEHQVIFRLCHDLHRAVTGRAPDDLIDSLLNELAIRSLEHFWHEERRMRSTAYPFYAWHKQQHHTARSKIKFFGAHFRAGDREAVRGLLTFLHGWLNDHIRLADRMLGAHLRNSQRELCAKAS